MKKILDKFKKIYATSLGGGISWNMVALGFMAISGLIYQAIIKGVYGDATNGLFGQAFSYYVAAAQLAVCGIHFSVLKYVSEFHEDDDKVAKIYGSSLIATAIIAIIIVGLSYLALYIVSFFTNDELLSYLYFIIPALFFFSINKVTLNYLNGLSRMKEYAVFQSLRNILIIVSVVVLVLLKLPGKYLVLSFLISELILFLTLGVYALKTHYIKLKLDKEWFLEHLRYGYKIMPGNFVLELNARMDVMILGWFASDTIVGIYYFALRFAEGFYQLLVVVRRNINPVIARNASKKEFNLLDELKQSLTKYSKYLIPISAVLVLFGYCVLAYIIGRDLSGFFPLLIVVAAIVATSKYIIFGNTLNQSGFPSQEARLNIITLCTNIALNFALIPFLGMFGAAIGTAVSYIVFSVILYKSTKKYVNYKI
jgi:O-antigen/teichoic acid export membrane protein